MHYKDLIGMKQKGFIDIVLVIVLVVAVTAGGYLIWRQKTTVPKTPLVESEVTKDEPKAPSESEQTPTPNPSTPTTQQPSPTKTSAIKTVALNETFTLQKGERVKLAGKEVYLKITGFHNQPCPQGANCVWSGLAVHYELTEDGKVYKTSTTGNLPAGSTYTGQTKDSDYTTYATMLIRER